MNPLQVLFVVLAWIGTAEVSGQELQESLEGGRLVYELHCARCHGPKGNGDGAQAGRLMVHPADFHSQRIRDKSDEQLLTSIEFGSVMTPMHAWRGRLTGREMQDVLSYLRRLSFEIK